MSKNIIAIITHVALILLLVVPREIREQLPFHWDVFAFVLLNVCLILLCIIDHIREGYKYDYELIYRIILSVCSLLFVYSIIQPAEQITFYILLFVVVVVFPLTKTLLYSMFSVHLVFIMYDFIITESDFDNYLENVFSLLTIPANAYVLLVGGYLFALTLYFFQKIEFETRFSSFLIGIVVAPIAVPYVVAAAILSGIYKTAYFIWSKYVGYLIKYNPIVGNARQHYLEELARFQTKERLQKLHDTIKKDYVKGFRQEIGHISFKRVLSDFFSLQHIYIYSARLLYIAVHIVLGYVLLAVFNGLHRLLVELLRMLYMVMKEIVYKRDLRERMKHGASFVCSTCYYAAPLPQYVCMRCGEHHVIEPGEFGIFKYRCQCGEKLANRHKTGRENLTAVCPDCHEVQTNKLVTPFVIPLLGQPNAGTTSFMYKGVQTLLNHELSNQSTIVMQPENQLSIEQYAEQNKVEPTLTTKPKAFNVKWQDETLFPKVLFLYDASGAIFQQYDLLKQLTYMEYADGYIFVIDSNLAEGKFRAKEMIDMMLIYFNNEQGVKINEKIDKPIAIIFNKSDALGYDTSELEVGKWLSELEAGTVYNDIQMNFSSVKYFFTNSSANSTNNSQAAAIKWIVKQASKTRKLEEGVI